jgi:hypothetical protein
MEVELETFAEVELETFAEEEEEEEDDTIQLGEV